MKVCVHQARDDKFAFPVNDPGAIRYRNVPRASNGGNAAVFDKYRALAKRISAGAINNGCAGDSQGVRLGHVQDQGQGHCNQENSQRTAHGHSPQQAGTLVLTVA